MSVRTRRRHTRRHCRPELGLTALSNSFGEFANLRPIAPPSGGAIRFVGDRARLVLTGGAVRGALRGCSRGGERAFDRGGAARCVSPETVPVLALNP